MPCNRRGQGVSSAMRRSRAGTDETARSDRRWYACYTRARHEKTVDRQLRGRGFESYLPLVERERRWKDRLKRVMFPVFPSYVFARFTMKEIHDVLTTPGVSTIVRVGGRPAAIPDAEMANVRRVVDALRAEEGEAELGPYVEEGQRVRVAEGPLRGVEGIVVERRGRSRVLVGLSAIRQGLEIDVAVETLEPIGR